MKTLRLLLAVGCTLVLAGCVVAPVGPHRHHHDRPVVVTPPRPVVVTPAPHRGWRHHGHRDQRDHRDHRERRWR